VHRRHRAIHQDHVAVAANQRHDGFRITAEALGEQVQRTALVVDEVHHLAQFAAQTGLFLAADQVRGDRIQAGHAAAGIHDDDAIGNRA